MTISLEVDSSLAQRLSVVAKSYGTSREQMLTLAIEQILSQYESSPIESPDSIAQTPSAEEEKAHLREMRRIHQCALDRMGATW